MQAEKSFRKSKKEKEERVTRRESEGSEEVMQGPEAACLVEARLKTKGSDWPVLLTCPGSRDANPALEGDKVCEMQCGEGIGLGCAVLECDLKLERIPLCHRENSGDIEAGAGGYRKHWAQLMLALHSSVPSAAYWWAAESTWKSWEGSEIHECLFCKGAYVPRQKAGTG